MVLKMGKCYIGFSGSIVPASIGKALCGFILGLIVCTDGALTQPVHAATYYISPTGSDGNNGLSTSTPWRTFAHALDPSRASCGDTLFLNNGVYGDGTSTGKLVLNGKACTDGNKLTIKAQNQRQARINDNGTGNPISITSSSYITLDGLYWNGANNSGATANGTGGGRIDLSNHINVLNSLGRNPNKYANASILLILSSEDVLVQQFEGYDYHRHCLNGFASKRVTVRLSYCNGRTGRIAGGYDAGTGLGKSDAMFIMYPCADCILESSINEGAVNGSYLGGINASYYGQVLAKNPEFLGNICLDCNHGNGLRFTSREGTGYNHSVHGGLVKNNAFVNHGSPSNSIFCSDCRGTVITNNTILKTTVGQGIRTSDFEGTGGTPADNSITITKNIVTGVVTNAGFQVEGYDTWTGGTNYSYNNGSPYSPSLPSNWNDSGNSVTTDPGLGTCKVWTRDGSAAKAAGAGANVLYQYSFGVEKKTPLWNPQTGEFPHGALVAGVNDVAGQSLFDIHKRLNVNTNGCSFPANYGDGVTDVDAPSTPAGLRLF